MRQQLIEAPDLAGAERALSSMYAGVRLTGRDGEDGGLRAESAVLGPLRFDRLTFETAVDVEVSALERLLFVQVRRGRLTYGSGPGLREYSAGDLCLAAQPEHAHVVAVRAAEVDVVTLDPGMLGEVADQAGRCEDVHLTGYAPVSPAATARWKATVAFLAGLARAGSGADGDTLLGTQAARLLAACALVTFPNDAGRGPVADDHRNDHRDDHPATLRRAIAFIETSLARDIGLRDIADAAHVSVRAVQVAFRRHLDTTPNTYLRKVRLDRARRELRGADPAFTTVGDVASRWGFANASRFAAQYRLAFGELPSRTLRR